MASKELALDTGQFRRVTGPGDSLGPDSGWGWTTVGTLVRLFSAAVWLAAGSYKVRDLDAAYVAVRSYDLIPHVLVAPVADTLGFVEIAFGLLFLVGARVRATAVAATLFDVVYIAGILSAAARHLRIDCGCFSPGGPLAPGVATHYTADLVRDGVFVLLGLFLIWRPRTWLSVDELRRRT